MGLVGTAAAAAADATSPTPTSAFAKGSSYLPGFDTSSDQAKSEWFFGRARSQAASINGSLLSASGGVNLYGDYAYSDSRGFKYDNTYKSESTENWGILNDNQLEGQDNRSYSANVVINGAVANNWLINFAWSPEAFATHTLATVSDNGGKAYGGNTAVNTGFFNLKLGTIQQESNWPAVINGTSNTLASSQISDSTGWAIKSILGWDGQILDWTGMKFLPVLDLGVFSSADNVTLADQANGTKSVTASSTLNQGQFSLLGDLLKLKWGEGERTATATGVAGTATATTAPLSDITVSTIFGLGATIKPGATWDLSKLGLIGQAASVLADLSLGLPGQNKTVVADDGTHAEAHQTGLGITAGLKIAANTGQLLSFSATLGSQDVEAQAPEGGIVLPGAECNTQYFSDVTPDMQFFNDICWLKEKGITTGWPDGTFRPVTPVARDAMAAFLYRQAGSPDVTLPKDPSFTDVPADNMFYKEIEWMQAKGIAAGWDDGTYRPLNDTNRDAMAAFIHRAVNQGIITLK